MLAVVIFFAIIGALEAACRTATQVELVVSYDGDCNELSGVAFIIGTEPYAVEKRIDTNVFTTTTNACSPGRIGTLVITPNASTDRTAVIVLAAFKGKRVEDCKATDGYSGCIIARRSLTFIEHTALSLEIELERACKDVPCDAVSTCKQASCVDSRVECSSDGCSSPGVLPDGGLARVDAPTSSDAFVQGDRAILVDAPVDSETEEDAGTDAATEAGVDASACTVSGLAVTCKMTDGGTKACAANESCCSGTMAAGEAGMTMGYDCRSGGCVYPPPELRCRSSKNCPANQICCLNQMYGSFCTGGSTCPSDAGIFQQLCEQNCECAQKSCQGSTATTGNPPQTMSTCN